MMRLAGDWLCRGEPCGMILRGRRWERQEAAREKGPQPWAIESDGCRETRDAGKGRQGGIAGRRQRSARTFSLLRVTAPMFPSKSALKSSR